MSRYKVWTDALIAEMREAAASREMTCREWAARRGLSISSAYVASMHNKISWKPKHHTPSVATPDLVALAKRRMAEGCTAACAARHVGIRGDTLRIALRREAA